MVMRHRRLLSTACTVVTGVLTAGLAASLAACSGGAAQPSNVITVSSNQCGGNWSVPGPGWHTFEIDNQSTGGGEIDLIDPAQRRDLRRGREHRPWHGHSDEAQPRLGDLRLHVQLH